MTSNPHQPTFNLRSVSAFPANPSSTVEQILARTPGLKIEVKPNELLVNYLFNKVCGTPMPCTDLVGEILLQENVGPDPGNIPCEMFKYGDSENLAYFFIFKEKGDYADGLRMAKTGTWKMLNQGPEAVIHDYGFGGPQVLGFQREFAFSFEQEPWFEDGKLPTFYLKEYRLHMDIIPQELKSVKMEAMVERWTVCEIAHMSTVLPLLKDGSMAQLFVRQGNGIVMVGDGVGPKVVGTGATGAGDGDETAASTLKRQRQF